MAAMADVDRNLDPEQITVVVPTLGRQHTLSATLRSCLDQTDINLSILVSDNSGTNATHALIDEINDGRIKTVRPPTKLCMAENWEFALSHITSGIVTYIGDDDALMPGAIQRVRNLMNSHPEIECLVHRPANYYWPDFIYENLAGNLQVPDLDLTFEIIESKHTLQSVALFQEWYGNLPFLYHGFVRHDLISRIKRSHGRPFFEYACPDIYSDILLAAHADKYMRLNDALTVGGQCGSSNGAMYSRFESSRKSFYNEMPKDLRPAYETSSINLLVYDALSKVVRLYPEATEGIHIDQLGFVRAVLNESLGMAEKERDMVLSVLHTSFSQELEQLEMPESRLNSSEAQKTQDPFIHKAISKASRVFSTSPLNRLGLRSKLRHAEASQQTRAEEYPALRHNVGCLVISDSIINTADLGFDMRFLGVSSVDDAAQRLASDMKRAQSLVRFSDSLIQYLLTDPPHAGLLSLLWEPDEPIVILDIGACEGEDSIRYKLMYPNAEILAMEPLPQNIQRMHKNISHSGLQGIRVVQSALSDHVGAATFHVSSGRPAGGPEDWDYGNKSSSLRRPAQSLATYHPWLNFNDEITVDVSTLDALLQSEQKTKVDFIHMDVQGSELDVFQGGLQTLQQTTCIWVEVGDVELYDGQPSSSQTESFLTSHGFQKILDHKTTGSADHFYINTKCLGLLSQLRHFQSPAKA